MTKRPILDTIENVKEFTDYLHSNPGIIIIKFGADWCKPCKTIETQVHEWFHSMPENVQCFLLDVDESFELYAFLKTKKMVNGVPALLRYDSGNVNYIPSDIFLGADKNGIDAFFQRCIDQSTSKW